MHEQDLLSEKCVHNSIRMLRALAVLVHMTPSAVDAPYRRVRFNEAFRDGVAVEYTEYPAAGLLRTWTIADRRPHVSERIAMRDQEDKSRERSRPAGPSPEPGPDISAAA